MNYTPRLRLLINGAADGRLIDRIKRMFPDGSLGRSIALLGGGTALGQGVIVLTTPLLTRLFSPSDFGVLGAFISVLSVWMQVIAWRYDQAIPLPREREVARSLLALSLLLSFLMVGVIGILSGPFAYRLFGSLESTGLLPYLWMMPVGVAGAGLFQILNCWAVREKAFSEMASVRVGQCLVIVCAQCLGGVIWIGPLGLIVGDTVGRCLGTGFFAALLWRKKQSEPGRISVSKMSAVARRYWRFPALSMGAGLVSNASLILPPLLFAVFFSTQDAGWFALALRIVGAPSFLVGQAVGQVYWGEAAERVRNDPFALKSLFFRVVKKLLALFVMPMTVLAIMGPWFFSLAFGETWRSAGECVQFLALPFLLRVAAVPISDTLTLLERQDWQMLWDSGRAILVIGGLFLAHHLGWSARDAVKLYAAAMTVCYASLILVSAAAINQRIGSHGSRTVKRPSGDQF